MADTLDIAFGTDPRQRLDLYNHDAARPRPLVVVLHGGGWTGGDKREHIHGLRHLGVLEDYAVAAVNHRLVVPAHPGRITVLDQVEDLRRALRHLHVHAAMLGLRTGRTVLFGFSSGAMIAATALLAGPSPPPPILDAYRPKAAIIVDGACFDIEKTMAWPHLHPRQRANLEAIFGTDRAFWEAASPAILSERTPPDRNLAWTLICGSAQQELSTRDFHHRLVKAGWTATLMRTGFSHGQFMSGRLGFDNPDSQVSALFRAVLASVTDR